MFLESILFLQKLKNFKNSVSLFWRLSHGSSKSHAIIASSRVGFGNLFVSERSSSKGVHRDFRGSARNSLASETSSREKHLANFFKSFGLKCFGGCPGDLLATCISREKRVFCVSKTVFKTFLVFPSNICDCSLSSPFLSLKHSMSHFKNHSFLHHFFSNLQEKGMGFLCLTSFFMFLVCFS